MKRPTQVKISESDKNQMMQKSYADYLQGNQRAEKIREKVLPMKKLQSMTKGYRSAPDNSKVTYKTRVKPKGFQRVMDAPYRIKNTTVKTGRGR